MTTRRDGIESKAMADLKKALYAHDLLEQLDFLKVLSKEQKELLRSYLPELPKQKTLKALRNEVYDAWVGTEGNEWADEVHGVLETWLDELHTQMQGLEHDAEPAHPEFLETEADYRDAPEGTIVAHAENVPCHKYRSKWSSVGFIEREDDKGMSCFSRRVLRWGW